MAVEFIMPFARANPSDFDDIREKIQERSPGVKKAVLERLDQFFAGFRDGTYDDDTVYGVACDLTSADVWTVVRPEELIPVLEKANPHVKSSFMDGLPREYKTTLREVMRRSHRRDAVASTGKIVGYRVRDMVMGIEKPKRGILHEHYLLESTAVPAPKKERPAGLKTRYARLRRRKREIADDNDDLLPPVFIEAAMAKHREK